MPPINTTDLAARANSQRDAAIEKESATLREWLSGISSQKGAIAGSVNNLVSVNKLREVTIDVSLPIPSDVEQKKPAPIDPRKTLPESVKSGAGIPRGRPYDLLAKITYSDPADTSEPSTDAEIGAIRHSSEGDYDRGALSKVDDTSAKMQVWDGPSASSERYVGMEVTDTKAHLWGYGDNGRNNFQALAEDGEGASLEVWGTSDSGNERYAGMEVTDTKAHLWGYGDNGRTNFQALAEDGEGASLEVWDTSDSGNAKYVKIKTDDFPANPSVPLFVKLREMEICEKDGNGNPYKILVLCSQKYSTQGG